jgi:hypothetical protein
MSQILWQGSSPVWQVQTAPGAPISPSTSTQSGILLAPDQRFPDYLVQVRSSKMADQLNVGHLVNKSGEVTAAPGMQFYRVTTIVDASPKGGGIPHV